MPSPGAGSVTSLSYMAQFLRSKNNNPSQGFAAGSAQRDVTRYQETFQRPGSIFGPGYPLVPPSRQLVRGWDYPVSWNTSFRPRSYEPIGFGELRSLAERHTITSLAIETRKDQIESLNWLIRVVGQDDLGRQVKSSKEQQGRIDNLISLFRYPDGTHDFGTWLRQLIDDVLVIDAAALEVRYSRGGKIIGFDQLDGGTIKVLLDETGRRPKHPDPAYQQIIHGRPWVLLEDGARADIDEGQVYDTFSDGQLVYLPRNPRVWKGYGRCYTPDVEILTRRGWLKFSELTLADQVATRNMRGKKFEWQQPTRIVAMPHSGPMLHFYSRSLDLLVTPAHRMLVTAMPRALGGNRSRPRGEAIIAAEDLAMQYNRGIKIPMTSVWCGGTEIGEQRFVLPEPEGTIDVEYRESYGRLTILNGTTKMVARRRHRGSGKSTVVSGDDYCALMGAYLAEGNIRAAGGIEINQRPESKGYVAYAHLMARVLGGPAPHNGKAFVVARKGLTEHFSKFGLAAAKFIPEGIMDAPARQIKIFWDHFVLGDGCFEERPNKSGRGQRPGEPATRITTVSERMANQLVELAQKLGWSAALRKRPTAGKSMILGREVTRQDSYVISVRYSGAMGFKVSKVDYSGTVHCVTVPNGIVYVRRNGKPAWCGNSPVEQVFTYMQIGLRLQDRQLAYFTEGNIPPGMINAPEGATRDQVREWQEWFDSKYSGNDAARAQIVWGPSGATYQPFTEPPFRAEFDVWLGRVVCYAFSLPPSWLTPQVNRATAQTAQETAQEEGQLPLKNWVVRLMNLLIQQRLGQSDLEFAWEEKQDIDPAQQATILVGYVKEGIYARNEAREKLGEDAIEGGDIATVDTAAGPIAVSDIAAISTLAANPPEPPPPAAGGGAGGAAGKDAGKPKGKPAPTGKGVTAQSDAEEVRKSSDAPFGEPASRRYLATDRDAIAKAIASFFKAEVPRVASDVMRTKKTEQHLIIRQNPPKFAASDARHTDPDQHGISPLEDPHRAREISATVAAALAGINWSRWSDLVGEISPHLEDASTQTITDTLAAVHADLTETQVEAAKAAARKWAQDRAAELVGRSRITGRTIPDASAENDITDSTARMIAEDVRQAIADKATVEELTKTLSNAYAFSSKRARSIADYETKSALHNARMTAFKASNRVKGSYWRTRNDFKVEATCLLNEAGSPVRLGHLFPSGHIAPLAHAGCRCWLTPWMEEST